jgi:flagellar biosynthesis/type III secretory pathway protein FliH
MTSSSARRLRHTRRVIPGEQAGALSVPSLVAPADDPLSPLERATGEPGRPEVFDEACRRAFDEGYRTALEAANRQGEERQAAARKVAEQVAEAALKVAQERQALVDEAVADAVDLALDLLAVLLGREIDQSTSPTRDALVRALSLVPEGEDLVVRMAPGTPLTEEEVRQLAPTARVRLIEDASVEEHGCVVETGRCRIDAQLSSALERVRRQLEPLRHAGHDTGGDR